MTAAYGFGMPWRSDLAYAKALPAVNPDASAYLTLTPEGVLRLVSGVPGATLWASDGGTSLPVTPVLGGVGHAANTTLNFRLPDGQWADWLLAWRRTWKPISATWWPIGAAPCRNHALGYLRDYTGIPTDLDKRNSGKCSDNSGAV